MSPDQIRRSWDDDDTPRSVFPEPLAERLTRENKELRAENERWKDKANEAGAAYATANSKHHEELDRANRLERMADTLAGKAVDLEDRARAAEARLDALVADLRGLADEAESGSGIVITPGFSTHYAIEVGRLRAVLDKHAGEQP